MFLRDTGSHSMSLTAASSTASAGVRAHHLPLVLHQGVPEGPAVPQALQHHIEEAVVFPGQVAQARGQAVVVGAGLMLHDLAASLCSRVCPMLSLFQAGLLHTQARLTVLCCNVRERWQMFNIVCTLEMGWRARERERERERCAEDRLVPFA